MKKLLSLMLAVMLVLACGIYAVQAEETRTVDVDVVIVGAGGAGMSAAIEAVEAGASAIILEKRPYAGGNTMRASGGVNAAGTDIQAAAGIEDSPEQFVQDILRQGKNNDLELVEYFASQGQETIDFCRKIGFEFSDTVQIQYNDPPRSHRDAENRSVGVVLVPLLLNQMELHGVTILYNTRATAFLTDEDGAVIGVQAEDEDGNEIIFHAGAVVNAAGGFGGSQELLAIYKPELVGYPTSGESTNTGDGILMAQAVGAKLANMDVTMTSALEWNTLYSPGVTMTRNGMIRFDGEGNHVASGNPNEEVIYGIYNATTEANSPTAAVFTSSGAAIIADTVRELAEKIGADPDVMEAAMNDYNEDYQSEEKIDRVTGSKITALVNIAESGPYYAIRLINGVHYTAGGVVINVNAETLNENDEVIPGLYSAGEVTGGLHGSGRYTGNSIPETIIFGRQAGRNAAAYALAKGHVEAPEIAVEKTVEIAAQGNYKDGTYTASALGLNGEVTLSAVFDGGSLKEITTVESPETTSIYAGVERQLFPLIIANQSTENVDTITGATYASQAVLNIMADIFEQASN